VRSDPADPDYDEAVSFIQYALQMNMEVGQLGLSHLKEIKEAKRSAFNRRAANPNLLAAYVELQRQLVGPGQADALEMFRLEIKKLRYEVAKLRAENAVLRLRGGAVPKQTQAFTHDASAAARDAHTPISKAGRRPLQSKSKELSMADVAAPTPGASDPMQTDASMTGTLPSTSSRSSHAPSMPSTPALPVSLAASSASSPVTPAVKTAEQRGLLWVKKVGNENMFVCGTCASGKPIRSSRVEHQSSCSTKDAAEKAAEKAATKIVGSESAE
jgi:hypothetical protein